MITTRFIVGVPFAAAITFGLFVLMRGLIAGEDVERVVYQEQPVIIIGRKVKDTETEQQEREIEKPQEEIERQEIENPDPGPDEGPDDMGPGSLDPVKPVISDVEGICGQPAVRIAPAYPRKASEQGIEGYAIVEFTVTTQGTVKDAVVVEQEPGSYFGVPAVRAVKRWRYRPCKINGKVQEVRLQVRLVFELDQS